MPKKPIKVRFAAKARPERSSPLPPPDRLPVSSTAVVREPEVAHRGIALAGMILGRHGPWDLTPGDTVTFVEASDVAALAVAVMWQKREIERRDATIANAKAALDGASIVPVPAVEAEWVE